MKYVILMAVIATGCVTNPNEVKTLSNHSLEVKGSVNGAKLGIDDKKEIVIQEEDYADSELRIQESANSKLQSDLNHESYMLKRCRMDLSHPLLGGDSKIPEIPEIDGMRDTEEVKEELGLNESGELKVVKKTYFVERLKSARKYERALRKMLKVTEKHREECEYKMAIARHKAGLPAERYQAEGYFLPNGAWVQTRKGEQSLTDALEIQAKAKQVADQ